MLYSSYSKRKVLYRSYNTKSYRSVRSRWTGGRPPSATKWRAPPGSGSGTWGAPSGSYHDFKSCTVEITVESPAGRQSWYRRLLQSLNSLLLCKIFKLQKGGNVSFSVILSHNVGGEGGLQYRFHFIWLLRQEICFPHSLHVRSYIYSRWQAQGVPHTAWYKHWKVRRSCLEKIALGNSQESSDFPEGCSPKGKCNDPREFPWVNFSNNP